MNIDRYQLSAIDTTDYGTMTSHLGSLPMATGNVVAQMETVLSSTLNDLSIRNEVGDCIQDMLLDLETTHHLQQQLELESTQRLLEKAQTEQQAVTLEAHAERLERYDRRVELADQFVVELLQVNREMKELMAWKEAHEYKVKNYDLILAKLAKTEADLTEAKKIASTAVAIQEQSQKEIVQETSTDQNDEQPTPPAESTPTEPTEAIPAETPEATTTATTDATDLIPETQPAEASAEISNEMDQKPAAIPQTEQENTQPAPAAEVVAIDSEADDEEDIPTILTLEMEPLMEVFGFLDAMDILNTAQISLSMYNKVDMIFGISEDGQTPPAPTPPPAPAPPKPATTSPAPTTAQNTTNAATAPLSSSGATGVMGSMFSSILQPAAAPAPPPAPPKPPPPTSAPQQSQPLNAAVAQSMASKLSDAELAAIISMTDKLSKLEKEVHLLKSEKEVYVGKLEGTEAVKQFLIGKVRDVELKLQRSKEDEIKVTQQIASDQEVIAFLDSRVQELEQQTETLTIEKSGTEAGFDDLKVSSSRKITMLSDMLKYEREKLREDESDWKATKKVLVKEVKSCRAQILALQAERDGLKEQNDMLRRAITSGKHHNGSPNKR